MGLLLQDVSLQCRDSELVARGFIHVSRMLHERSLNLRSDGAILYAILLDGKRAPPE